MVGPKPYRPNHLRARPATSLHANKFCYSRLEAINSTYYFWGAKCHKLGIMVMFTFSINCKGRTVHEYHDTINDYKFYELSICGCYSTLQSRSALIFITCPARCGAGTTIRVQACKVISVMMCDWGRAMDGPNINVNVYDQLPFRLAHNHYNGLMFVI